MARPAISTTRVGATLIEVLVAIFVMAIGMLALLTLFPIGALRMAQAIQEERCRQAGVNASALANAHQVRTDAQATTAGAQDLYQNPVTPPYAVVLPDAHPDGPSYPIYVDPFLVAAPPPAADWVGNAPGILRRRSPSYVTGVGTQMGWFTLLDDLTYDANTPGQALQNGPGVVNRDTRYSWTYLLQRPLMKDPTSTTCTVVVYNKRPLGLTNTLLVPENVYTNRPNPTGIVVPSFFDVASNLITIDYTTHPLGAAGKPQAAAGDWLLDATPDRTKPVTTPAGTVQMPVPHANFYRIVGVNDPAPNAPAGRLMIQYEVDRGIKGFTFPGPGGTVVPVNADPNDSAFGFIGTTVFLEGVAEVFEKGVAR